MDIIQGDSLKIGEEKQGCSHKIGGQCVILSDIAICDKCFAQNAEYGSNAVYEAAKNMDLTEFSEWFNNNFTNKKRDESND